MSLVAYKPPTPYRGTFMGQVSPGFNIFITGTPTANTRFGINLCTDFSEQRCIPFHMNPRFPDNKVIRNTKSNGCWGGEERSGPFPFKVGEIFQIHIQAGQSAFTVEVNGNPFCTYNYRVPPHTITVLEVCQDVKIHNIHTQ